MTRAYDIWNEERGASQRAIFVIDKEGTVRFKKTYASARDLDPKDILAEIDKL